MTVWYVEAGPVGRVAMLVVPEQHQDTGYAKRFLSDGTPLVWPERPRLVSYVDARGKRKPSSDVSPFVPEALVLNPKAFNALGSFLSKFGQLLELDVDGEDAYFFNATNMIACVDRERSEVRASGSIAKEAFLDGVVPSDPAVFKDPTMRSRLYTNDAGKQVMEDAAREHGVTGLWFRRAGL